MADTGGMLTKDRLEAVRQAAERIEDMAKLLGILDETTGGDGG